MKGPLSPSPSWNEPIQPNLIARYPVMATMACGFFNSFEKGLQESDLVT